MNLQRLFLPALALLSSCSASTEPGWSRVLGLILDEPEELSSLDVPAEATRDSPVEIIASTFGSSSCTSPDGYDLSVQPAAVEIHLYDRVAPPDSPCTEDLRRFPRTLVVRFSEIGAAEVALTGRGLGGQPLTIRRSIVVR